MTLPSFEKSWHEGKTAKARIYLLEVRDRVKPKDDPIAWLLVERQENYRREPREGSIDKASIRISYERIEPQSSHKPTGKGYFSGGYARGTHNEIVSLTSESTNKGAVFLDLPGLHGQRIGTYLMHEIVTWVRRWPEAAVRSVGLLEGQAHGENKDRRNRLYEQIGLEFDYRDPEHREGVSRPMLAKALRNVVTWKENLRECDVRDHVSAVLLENERLRLALSERGRAIADLGERISSAEAAPMRWALSTWWRALIR